MPYGQRLTIRLLPAHEKALQAVIKKARVGERSEAIRFCVNLATEVLKEETECSEGEIERARKSTLAQRGGRWK